MEQVKVFKYLGRVVVFENDDTHVVQGNLAKAQRVWASISRILRAENASTRVNEMIYKSTVQAVLLYGSET